MMVGLKIMMFQVLEISNESKGKCRTILPNDKKVMNDRIKR